MKPRLQIISESLKNFIEEAISKEDAARLPSNKDKVMLGTEIQGTVKRGLHVMSPGMVYDPNIELDAQGNFIVPEAWRRRKEGETRGAFRPTVAQSLSDAAPAIRAALHRSGFYKNNPSVDDPT